MKKEKFIIVGAGIAGLTTAFILQELNYSYILVEANADVRGIGAGFGLASNAMRGFDAIGLEQDIHSIGHTITSLQIVDQFGKAIIAADTSKLDQQVFANFAVHRADLHQYLVQKIDASTLLTAKKFERFEENANGITVYFQDGTQESGDYLIAADGVGSKIRQQILPTAQPRYAGYVCWRAVIENPGIELPTSIETWGKNGRFGLTPLINQQIYWYACINAQRHDVATRQMSIAALRNNFSTYHAPIVATLAATTQEKVICNDIIDIQPIKNYHFNRVLLMGDAAHATTPNMGQGACMAIEDVAVLHQALMQENSIQAAFQRFNSQRVKRANGIIRSSDQIGKIAQLQHPTLIALRNFVMRRLPERFSTSQLQQLLSTDFLQ